MVRVSKEQVGRMEVGYEEALKRFISLNRFHDPKIRVCILRGYTLQILGYAPCRSLSPCAHAMSYALRNWSSYAPCGATISIFK